MLVGQQITFLRNKKSCPSRYRFECIWHVFSAAIHGRIWNPFCGECLCLRDLLRRHVSRKSRSTIYNKVHCFFGRAWRRGRKNPPHVSLNVVLNNPIAICEQSSEAGLTKII